MRHQAWSSPIGNRKRNRAWGALQRIADTLGMPVETLMQHAGREEYPDDTAELVRLWHKIEDDGTRRSLLALVRMAAGETGQDQR